MDRITRITNELLSCTTTPPTLIGAPRSPMKSKIAKPAKSVPDKRWNTLNRLIGIPSRPTGRP
jgi:hypothetical protein